MKQPSEPTRVALLWHLHQPEYRDPATGIPTMPWTRLHALRGYRDLLVESLESGVPWTLNIVPGLWEQILYYARGGSDRHLDLTRAAPSSLTPEERRDVEASFPCGNRAMRATSRRYLELEAQLERGRLDDAQLLDLQVLSTLVWTGSTARRDFPLLRELIAKDRGFDLEDKRALLRVQRIILREFPALLSRLAAVSGPSVSTTPLHHPILPLLINVQHAARCQTAVPDVEFAYPDDAVLQLVRGREAMATWLGNPPMGCWPSEGSVSPETIEAVGAAGFRWVATDDGVLHRSEVVRDHPGGGGWTLGHGVRGFFRDHALSDRIGFEYANWDAEHAVADFFEQVDAREGVVVVALDGENPWEAFEDAGHAFRAGLMAGLLRRGVTLDALCEEPPVGEVVRLHTGSWIGADFGIWAGSEADARAWSLLADCRAAVKQASSGVDEAMEHILAAEGSDWFWWYGPEFSTPFASTFDRAFRHHLMAAWSAIGEPVPEALHHPVEVAARDRAVAARPFDPQAEGFAAWLGAGSWVLPQGSMAQSTQPIVRFAWDLTGTLWVSVPEGISVIEVNAETIEVQGKVATIDNAPSCCTIRIGSMEVDLLRRDWSV